MNGVAFASFFIFKTVLSSTELLFKQNIDHFSYYNVDASGNIYTQRYIIDGNPLLSFMLKLPNIVIRSCSHGRRQRGVRGQLSPPGLRYFFYH